MNGRIVKYPECGFTCHTARGQSAVDYNIIMDSLLLCHVHKFHIAELTPLSDHCGITAHIQYNKSTDTQLVNTRKQAVNFTIYGIKNCQINTWKK